MNINLKNFSNFIELSISDTGIGIKEEEVLLIFNRFYRASSHREKNQEVSGIGLFVAKTLVSNLYKIYYLVLIYIFLNTSMWYI